MGDVFRANKWPSNAEMIEDVASVGYLDGRVLDVTYGYGTFWKKWCPKRFEASDIAAELSPTGTSIDFRDLSWRARSFDSVVLDGPYKLNGTPSESDIRYGVQIPARWQDRIQLIKDGMDECARVTRRYMLVKCMDQVAWGHVRWQTSMFKEHAESLGFSQEDRFDMLVDPRPQRGPQKHARANYSTLLIFEKV